MSDLIDDGVEAGNAPEFSVTEISGAIKRVIEGEFSRVRIRGELGRVSRPRSGHVYLDLKDDRSVISGVVWKGVASRLATLPEEGMEVIVVGRITTFGGQSKYQIVIDDIRPAGVGALMAMLEKRRKTLEAEGLFSAQRKKPIPYLPEIIGVVTSPSGAVIRDILHRLRDRFPRHVLIWPVAVQGAGCAPEVARAIAGFNALAPGGTVPRPDLLIVARGGGSVEDLWGFNEEQVARAVAGSDIPVISAVGHETDTTLIDYVADRRAPTPTAAAEMAVPVRLELLAWLEGQGGRLAQALNGAFFRRTQRLRDVARALPRAESLLEAPRQRLDTWGDRLPVALGWGVARRRVHLSEISGVLQPSGLRRAVAEERRRLDQFATRLRPALLRAVDRKAQSLAASRVSSRLIELELTNGYQKVTGLFERLCDAGQRHRKALNNRLEAAERLRETLGYKATLERGYAVVRGDAAIVTRKTQAQAAQRLEIEFADGRLAFTGPKPARARSERGDPPEQGSLF